MLGQVVLLGFLLSKGFLFLYSLLLLLLFLLSVFIPSVFFTASDASCAMLFTFSPFWLINILISLTKTKKENAKHTCRVDVLVNLLKKA